MIRDPIRFAPKLAGAALALALSATLAGCGGMATNRAVESIHQPVVERVNYTLDLTSSPSGLPHSEQRRLADWFASLNLRYGDKVTIDDPLQSATTRQAIEAIANRYGVLLGATPPVTPGYVNAGSARVVVTRTAAHVPGCPDWSKKSDTNWNNATSSNYGCATNSNLAAMVANPEHLIRGDDSQSSTTVMSSDKAIATYRKAEPTGSGGLKQTSSKSGD